MLVVEMVWVNVMLKNDTPWFVREAGNSSGNTSVGTRKGTLSCGARSSSECKLRAEPGFLGVEKGVEYRFTITCGSSANEIMSVWLCFPAVGYAKYDLSEAKKEYIYVRRPCTDQARLDACPLQDPSRCAHGPR